MRFLLTLFVEKTIEITPKRKEKKINKKEEKEIKRRERGRRERKEEKRRKKRRGVQSSKKNIESTGEQPASRESAHPAPLQQ